MCFHIHRRKASHDWQFIADCEYSFSTGNNSGQLPFKSSFLASNNAIQVSVKDNGLGTDENEKQKILKPFHTTKKDGAGMVYLSVVHLLRHIEVRCISIASLEKEVLFILRYLLKQQGEDNLLNFLMFYLFSILQLGLDFQWPLWVTILPFIVNRLLSCFSVLIRLRTICRIPIFC